MGPSQPIAQAAPFKPVFFPPARECGMFPDLKECALLAVDVKPVQGGAKYRQRSRALPPPCNRRREGRTMGATRGSERS